jgi:hypothetical protein
MLVDHASNNFSYVASNFDRKYAMLATRKGKRRARVQFLA